MSNESELDNNGPGHVIINSRLIRLAMFLVSNTLIASCAVFSVVSQVAFGHCQSQFSITNSFLPLPQINFEDDFDLNAIDTATETSTTIQPMNYTITGLIMNATVSLLPSTTALPSSLSINSSAATWQPMIHASANQLHETASVYLFCCALSLAAISAFLRAGFVLKFLVMMACIGMQGTILHLSRLYQKYDSNAGER